MPNEFTLELYFEGNDKPFADGEADKLKRLVNKLAPHLVLDVLVLEATNIVRSVFCYEGVRHDVPNHEPSVSGRQALLITSEDIDAKGWAGSDKGCLSRLRMREKADAGGDSADITIHEWLHTVEGLKINGRPIPNPHKNEAFGFKNASGKSPDGDDTWHAWYRFMLRER